MKESTGVGVTKQKQNKKSLGVYVVRNQGERSPENVYRKEHRPYEKGSGKFPDYGEGNKIYGGSFSMKRTGGRDLI